MYNDTRTYISYKYNYKSFCFFKMKYLNGEHYVEVKDHRYRIHPTENMILRKRDPPTALRTQYQVQNENQIRRNQKVIKNDKDELVVEN